MTVFEHSFTLIGLVLGLALTHVLSELVRIVRARGIKSLGLLTPMLAVLVILDIATFWGILWEMRLELPSLWPVLGIGIVLSSLYYIGASFIFPSSEQSWSDLDTYYMQYRRVVLGIMLLCYATVVVMASLLSGGFSGDPVTVSYLVALVLTLCVPWRWANVAGLLALIFVDIWAFVP